MKKVFLTILLSFVLVFTTLNYNTINAEKSYSPSDLIGNTINDITIDPGFKEILSKKLGVSSTHPFSEDDLETFGTDKFIINEELYGDSIKKLKSLEGIQYFSKLVTFEIHDTSIEVFPNEIFKIKNITKIVIKGNKSLDLNTMANRFDDIPNLTDITLENVKSVLVPELPASFYNLENIEKIRIHSVELESFEKIPNIKNIKSLELASLYLNRLPSNIHLINENSVVEHLNFIDNNFTYLSEGEYHLFNESDKFSERINGQKKHYSLDLESLTKPLHLGYLPIFDTLNHIVKHDKANVQVQYLINRKEVSQVFPYDLLYSENGLILPLENLQEISKLMDDEHVEYFSIRVQVLDGALKKSRYTFELNKQNIDKDVVLFNIDENKEISRVNITQELGKTTTYQPENFDHLVLVDGDIEHVIDFQDSSDYVINYEFKTYDMNVKYVDENNVDIADSEIISEKYGITVNHVLPTIKGFKPLNGVTSIDIEFDGQSNEFIVIYAIDASDKDDNFPGLGDPGDNEDSNLDVSDKDDSILEEEIPESDLEDKLDDSNDEEVDVEKPTTNDPKHGDKLPATGIGSSIMSSVVILLIGLSIVLFSIFKRRKSLR